RHRCVARCRAADKTSTRHWGDERMKRSEPTTSRRPAGSVRRWCILLATLATITVTLAPAARAGGGGWTKPILLSGPTLLPAPNAPGWCGSPSADQGWEFNTTIAVDPTNKANLV